MKKHLSILIIILISLPLIAVSWMAQRFYQEQTVVQQAQFKDLLNAELLILQNRITSPLQFYSQHLQTLAPELINQNTEQLRQRLRDDALINQLFIQQSGGQLSFPPSGMTSSQQERDFIQRTSKIRRDDLLTKTNQENDSKIQQQKMHGWYRWHWENGTNLLYWVKNKQGQIIAFELDFIGLLADIIGELPTDNNQTYSGNLLTADKSPLYTWGNAEPKNFIAAAQIMLPAPLDNWQLSIDIAPDEWQKHTSGDQASLLIGFVTLILALIGLGVYLYREFTRHVRDAAQKVNFVNQVSHELRTPLTNIRLYAELMHENDELEDSDKRKLGIIISESQRLTRLISNILSYARQQKRTLKINPAETEVVTLVTDTLEQFRPGLSQKQIQISQTGVAKVFCKLDPDALTQILGNLFSNVEKYGKQQLNVDVAERDGHLVIKVCDQGSGIPAKLRKRIFQPFYRIHNKLTEGVSGTGIGLNISRQLARLHHGDLVLLDTQEGCCFECRIPCKTEKKS